MVTWRSNCTSGYVLVLEIKCKRSFVGVSRFDRVRNDEVRTRAGIEKGVG